MKRIISCLFVILTLNSAHGQGHFSLGDNVASLGLGLGSSLGFYSGGTASPGISLQLEHGQWGVGGPGVISIGGYLGYKSFKYSGSYITYNYSQKWTYTVLGVRSAYHYNGLPSKDFDVYGGAMLSYNILSYSYSDNDPAVDYNSGNWGSGLGLSLYVGGRYYFQENLAAFLELGYGIAYANIGVALKF
jgi:hypothetical protein